ncbi:BatA domain-containing protein [bacterium]|nr:BatA domain-containing protein [bacterium]
MAIVFKSYLGLIFFFWLPIFVAIYFFKKTPKNEIVSSHFLWKKVLDNKVQSSWRDKLQKSALFWLQLLLFIFLFLSLSEPKLDWNNKTFHKVAIIVDNSGSMSTKIGVSNRLYQAKELASYYKSKNNALVDLYTWNKTLTKISDGKDFDFHLASISESHFPNGSPSNLMKRVSELKKDVDTFYFISDYLSLNLRMFFKNNHYSYSVVGGNNDNSFIQSIDLERSLNGTYQLEIKYIAKDSGPIPFEVKSFGSKKTFTNRSSRAGKNNFKISLDKKPEIWLSIALNDNDSLEADNVKVRYLKGKKLNVTLSNAIDFPLWNLFFKGFFDDDSRFELNHKNLADLHIRLSKTIPKVFLKNSLYLITGISSQRALGKNFVLSEVNDITAYLSEESFQTYLPTDFDILGEDLIVNISKDGEKTPLLRELENGSYLLNLNESIANISNSNISILFENLLQKYVKEKGSKNYYEVGDLLDGFIANENSSATQIGVYEKQSIKRYYNFPSIESNAKHDREENFISDFTLQSKFTSSKDDNSLYLWGLLIALSILLLEWIIFVKRI